MPICIECSYPVPQLYHVLHSRPPRPPPGAPTIPPKPSTLASSQKDSSKPPAVPDDRRPKARKGAGGYGSDVRLTQCPRCKRFADKYVEYDYVVLFIDLVLVKPQVYRHLLFNRLHRDDEKMDPSITRLGILLLLFEVYITWSRVESLQHSLTANSSITNLPILLQYCFFLFLCIATTAGQHLTLRWLAWGFGLTSTSANNSANNSASVSTAKKKQSNSTTTGSHRDGHAENNDVTPHGSSTGNPPTAPPPPPPSKSSFPTWTQPCPKKPSPNAISTAVFVSSCMSLFPLLMVVWKYDDPYTTSPSSSTSTNQSNTSLYASPYNASSILFSSGFLSPTSGKGVDWVRRGVSWIVALQNLEALRIVLGCGYPVAGGLVVAGETAKFVLRTVILRVVGLENVE